MLVKLDVGVVMAKRFLVASSFNVRHGSGFTSGMGSASPIFGRCRNNLILIIRATEKAGRWKFWGHGE